MERWLGIGLQGVGVLVLAWAGSWLAFWWRGRREGRHLLFQVSHELRSNAELFRMQLNPFSGHLPFHRQMVQLALANRHRHWPKNERLATALNTVDGHLQKVQDQWELYNDYRFGRLPDAVAKDITEQQVYLEADCEAVTGLFNGQQALRQVEEQLYRKPKTLLLDARWADLVLEQARILPSLLARPMVTGMHRSLLTAVWDHFVEVANGIKTQTITRAAQLPDVPESMTVRAETRDERLDRYLPKLDPEAVALLPRPEPVLVSSASELPRELGIVLAGSGHTPAIITPAFLRTRGIFPDAPDTCLVPPTSTPTVRDFRFTDGTRIFATPITCELGATDDSFDDLSEATRVYFRTFPGVIYAHVFFTVRGIVELKNPEQFMLSQIISSGPWSLIPARLRGVSCQFFYGIDAVEITVSLTPGGFAMKTADESVTNRYGIVLSMTVDHQLPENATLADVDRVLEQAPVALGHYQAVREQSFSPSPR